MLEKLKYKITSFKDDEDGIIIISFAIVFMLLLTLLVGMVEYSDAFTVKRRVKAAAYSVADIMARTENAIDQNTIGDMRHVVNEYLKPYVNSNPVTEDIIIKSVLRSQNNNLSVQFTCDIGTSGAADCSSGGDIGNVSIDFHDGGGNQAQQDSPFNNNFFVVAVVRYRYNSPVTFFFQNGVEFEHTAIVPARGRDGLQIQDNN